MHELSAESIHTADGAAEPHAIVQVTTPQGALSDRRRAGLAEDATKLVLEATGWGEEAGLRVWVLCREIDEGSWAANGQIIQFEQLRAAAKAETREGRLGPRQGPRRRGRRRHPA